MTSAAKAARLLELHAGPVPLLLPNVWDVAGARMLEEMGFPAIATTSAGIANSLGYADGQHLTRSEMLEVVARIAAAVQIPVTADMEAGYGDDLSATVSALIKAGAVGLNLEDSQNGETSLVPVVFHAARIVAVRAASSAAGVPLVINARVDAYFLNGTQAFEPFDETLTRARAYRTAGADCIFVPGLHDLGAISRLLQASPGPLNILGVAPSVAELGRVGVRRISLGSGPYRAAIGLLRRIAADLRTSGTTPLVAEYAVSPGEANGWFAQTK